MSRELTFSNVALTGANLYALVLIGGKAWNGAAFEVPIVANWPTYAIAMTESAGTGYFYADMPATMPKRGLVDVIIRKRLGSNPAATDPDVGSGVAEWYSPFFHEGYARGGTVNTVQLAADFPNVIIPRGSPIQCDDGALKGQVGICDSYDNNTKTATIMGNWIGGVPDDKCYMQVTLATESRVNIRPDGLDDVDMSDPGGMDNMTTLPTQIAGLFRDAYGPKDKSVSTGKIRRFADNGTTVNTSQDWTDDGQGNETLGKAT